MNVTDRDESAQNTEAENAPRVFVSHASPDAAVAQRIVAALERDGIRCWIAPRNVSAGAQYADVIVRAISEAPFFLVLLSAHAIASAHVGREVERAGSKGRRFLALRLDSAALTPALEYFLSESQWVDLAAGEGAAEARLAQAIRQAPGAAIAAPTQAAAKPSVKRVPIAIGVCAALTLVGFLGWKSLPPKPVPVPGPPPTPVAAIAEKSIAVLPFADMSEKKDQEYFSDGLSEELIDLLTKVRELRVPARASSFYFKGQHATIPEIAKALSVTYVLEGSVRRSGDTMRVRTELIRADNGFNVWSETYDRKIADVFKMQDDIAAAVVEALSVALAGGTSSAERRVTNPEAYDLYLQGINASRLSDDSLDGYRTVVSLIERSVEIDPSFGAAWAALARTYFAMSEAAGPVTSKGAIEKARSATAKALQLAPNAAEAHTALQRLKSFDWDWKGAEQEARRALELEPANTTVLRNASYLYRFLGQCRRAVEYMKTAVGLDPLDFYNMSRLGMAYGTCREWTLAEAAYRKAIELNPGAIKLRADLAYALMRQGHAREALATVELEPSIEARAFAKPAILDALGRATEADAAARQLSLTYGSQHPSAVAAVFLDLGSVDQAYLWFERALEAYDSDLLFVTATLSGSVHPELATDARFKALLRKMKFPEVNAP